MYGYMGRNWSKILVICLVFTVNFGQLFYMLEKVYNNVLEKFKFFADVCLLNFFIKLRFLINKGKYSEFRKLSLFIPYLLLQSPCVLISSSIVCISA